MSPFAETQEQAILEQISSLAKNNIVLTFLCRFSHHNKLYSIYQLIKIEFYNINSRSNSFPVLLSFLPPGRWVQDQELPAASSMWQ